MFCEQGAGSVEYGSKSMEVNELNWRQTRVLPIDDFRLPIVESGGASHN